MKEKRSLSKTSAIDQRVIAFLPISVLDLYSVGMFLLARLILDNLADQDNLEDLEEELSNDKLPRGIDEAYVVSPSIFADSYSPHLVI